nr:hypothetical protein [uncultured Macellibacteroides sp.]
MKKWNYLIFSLCLLIGFYIGRKTVTTEVTAYIPQKPITGHLEPIITSESKPDTPNLPMRDTVYLPGDPVVQVVDTAKIIEEYQLLRKYSEMLFDNEYGSLKLNSEVQYNKLQSLDYRFVPIQKVTTINKKKVFVPYVRGSYSTLGFFGVGGGTYYYDVGFDIQYQTDLTRSGFEAGVSYKF